MRTVHLLDYVAGNARSLANAFERLGFRIEWVREPEDIERAELLILPGVGHFGHCVRELSRGGFLQPLRKHIDSGKPFMGICVGLQVLFDGSEEDPNTPGLGIVPGKLRRFRNDDKSVPHIGWNSAICKPRGDQMSDSLFGLRNNGKYYFVHSYAALYEPDPLRRDRWSVATTKYGDEVFVGALARGNVFATQFHPEKSGVAGLDVLRAFGNLCKTSPWTECLHEAVEEGLTRRVVACLDVRTNHHGDLVVTKGDQYDVHEKPSASGVGAVRNLGKPVELARKYYEQGADEITFLNITSFRDCPVTDIPMLEVLKQTSRNVFVPLTVGGGIRATTDVDGRIVSALEVASLYFKSGADKVSIGSDAVYAAEEFIRSGSKTNGKSAIEQISAAYGNQAVIVSIDPKRVYVSSPEETNHSVTRTVHPNSAGDNFCWFQCTVKGGREARDVDVQQLSVAVEAMGAGEILLNSIDKDGSNSGFDIELIDEVKKVVKIPVIASSGAGNPYHFEKVFTETTTDAALGAGIFHRSEYTVGEVKDHLLRKGIVVRPFEGG